MIDFGPDYHSFPPGTRHEKIEYVFAADNAPESTALSAAAIALRDTLAKDQSLRPPELEDVLGPEYRNHELNSVERDLFHGLIEPLVRSHPDATKVLDEILRGAHVVVEHDDAWVWEQIRGMKDFFLRESSHYSVAPEYTGKLNNLACILTGVIRTFIDNGQYIDNEGRRFNYSSWFQLEGAPMWNRLTKNVAEFDERFRPQPEDYDNSYARDLITYTDMFKHGVRDYFFRYKIQSIVRKRNVGPFGRSDYHDGNPLRVRLSKVSE